MKIKLPNTSPSIPSLCVQVTLFKVSRSVEQLCIWILGAHQAGAFICVGLQESLGSCLPNQVTSEKKKKKYSPLGEDGTG